MAESYIAGDIDVDKLVISSSRGVLDLKTSFVSMSIYESIVVPGTMCDINVLDTKRQLETLHFTGDEIVEIALKTRGSAVANFRFALHELSDLSMIGAQTGKTYTLKCCSEEALHAKTNYIQKSYNVPCSDIVKDIHTQYLKSTKPIITETSMSPQKILIQNENPYAAIKLVKSRAVSSENRTSSYVYYEFREQEKQKFAFVTIEQLFKQNPVKSFQQSDALNTNILLRNDNNILAYKVPRQFSAIDKIRYGGPRNVQIFNTTTLDYQRTIVRTTDGARDGGTGTNISADFENKYFLNVRNPPSTFGTIDHYIPDTNIPDSIPNQQAYIAQLLQNTLMIRVPGDTALTAGSMINCSIPNKNGLTGNRTEDDLLSGKFLVTRIHHRIGAFGESPRYTCIIECIKGRDNKSVR